MYVYVCMYVCMCCTAKIIRIQTESNTMFSFPFPLKNTLNTKVAITLPVIEKYVLIIARY